MLLWSALTLLAAALTLAARWGLRRRDGLGRPRPFPTVSVVSLALVGAALLVPVVRHHRLEQRLDAVATDLVGAPVQVRCQTAGQEFVDAGAELGYVRYGAGGVPEHATLIKRAQCTALADYLGSDKADPGRDEVVAVHVLTHEAMHMAGETAEAVAECRAVQRDARTAELLGATREQARRLAEAYVRNVLPQMPEEYLTPDCVAGGALDERLAPSPWSAGAS
ncbi:MAG: hypothetical protein ABI807_04950 [Sporichthyaceae bacterium]